MAALRGSAKRLSALVGPGAVVHRLGPQSVLLNCRYAAPFPVPCSGGAAWGAVVHCSAIPAPGLATTRQSGSFVLGATKLAEYRRVIWHSCGHTIGGKLRSRFATHAASDAGCHRLNQSCQGKPKASRLRHVTFGSPALSVSFPPGA